MVAYNVLTKIEMVDFRLKRVTELQVAALLDELDLWKPLIKLELQSDQVQF